MLRLVLLFLQFVKTILQISFHNELHKPSGSRDVIEESSSFGF